MKDLLALAVYLGLWAFGVFCWVYAIIADAKADRVIWLLVDIMAAPIGVIRGFILWL